jgi:hypothetical protein
MTTWEVAMLFAGANGGKTALMLHLGMCIATGRPFAGREVLQGAYIHCVGEGNRGFRKRVAALFRRFGVKQDNSTPFYVLDEVPNLCDPENAKQLIADIEDQISEPPKAIALDTLSKAMPSGDDSNPVDMKALLASCRLIADHFKCVVVLLHHPGWADRGRVRGWSGSVGDVDTEIKIDGKSRQTRTATITKSRDLECIEATMKFDITREPIMAHGQRLTAASVQVVQEWMLDAPATVDPVKGGSPDDLSPSARRAQKALQELGGRAMLKEWRTKFKAMFMKADADPKKADQAFRTDWKGHKDLIERGMVDMDESELCTVRNVRTRENCENSHGVNVSECEVPLLEGTHAHTHEAHNDPVEELAHKSGATLKRSKT